MSRSLFIYESKFHQQTKEFVVDYNKALIAPVLEVVREVSQGYRAGIAPDRPTWATGPEGKVCVSCSLPEHMLGSRRCRYTESGDERSHQVQRSKPAARKRALRDAEVRRTGHPRGHHRSRGRGVDAPVQPVRAWQNYAATDFAEAEVAEARARDPR